MVNLCSRVAYKSASTAFKENKMSVLHRDQKVFSKANGKNTRTEKILHVATDIHMHTNIESHTIVKKAMNDLKLKHRS